MSRRGGVVAVAAVIVALLVALGVIVTADERPAPEVEALVYVAVGASDSVGVGAADPARDAWPVIFLRESLPDGTRFTNVAVSGATAAEALVDQVPKAVAAEPDLVTVWLNVNDLRAFVEPGEYRTQIEQILRALRRDGRTTVLVANTPELDELPVFERLPIPSALVEARVEQYNDAVEEAAAETGAVVVDLHRASVRYEDEDRIASLTSADGFHPNTAGYREVARVFGEAYRTLR